jgi:hypothetical protein
MYVLELSVRVCVCVCVCVCMCVCVCVYLFVRGGHQVLVLRLKGHGVHGCHEHARLGQVVLCLCV